VRRMHAVSYLIARELPVSPCVGRKPYDADDRYADDFRPFVFAICPANVTEKSKRDAAMNGFSATRLFFDSSSRREFSDVRAVIRDHGKFCERTPNDEFPNPITVRERRFVRVSVIMPCRPSAFRNEVAERALVARHDERDHSTATDRNVIMF